MIKTCHNFIKNVHLRFYTNCGTFSHPLPLTQLWVHPLPHKNIHLIFGLNFLIAPDRALLLAKDYALFLSTPVIAPILSNYPSEVSIGKRGDPPSKSPSISTEECHCPIKGSCTSGTC